MSQGWTSKHYLVNVRRLVAREAEETNLPFLLSFQCFGECSLFDDPFRVIVVVDLVELPEVEDIGFESSQAIFEMFAGSCCIAGAVLGHEEDFFAFAVLRRALRP